MGKRRGLLLLVLVCAALVVPSGAGWAKAATTVSTSPPVVSGTPRYATLVAADPGTWSPEPESVSYQWLVDGEPVAEATSSSYTPRLGDIGHELRVRVTATATGLAPGTAVSAPVTVARALFRRSSIDLDGVPRYGGTLSLGSFSTTPAASSTRRAWIRDGKALSGETGRSHRLRVSDVGHRVGLRVTARRTGYVPWW